MRRGRETRAEHAHQAATGGRAHAPMPAPGKETIVDLATLDLTQIVADRETIRRYNAQRFEMEQLTAIVLEDLERKVCVGYLDLPVDAFWARGHMPGMPLMPGVLMCEAAAQLCSYFSGKHDLLGTPLLGFGGLDEVRFRDPVFPGQRLVIACEIEKVRRGGMLVCHFQAFVNANLVCEGRIRGVPLPTERLADAARAASAV